MAPNVPACCRNPRRTEKLSRRRAALTSILSEPLTSAVWRPAAGMLRCSVTSIVQRTGQTPKSSNRAIESGSRLPHFAPCAGSRICTVGHSAPRSW
eukprot:6315808-Prymnesium_polylepis.2